MPCQRHRFYKKALIARSVAILIVLLVTGCEQSVLNNPYPDDAEQNVLYSSFSERPKHLDPAISYASNEYAFIGQIYEPPLHYHYLKRPYTLEPRTSTEVPKPQFLDKDGNPLAPDAPLSEVAFSRYRITIKPGIYYQPHPAFALNDSGEPLYRELTALDLKEIQTPANFKQQASRELVAADYVHQIKRFSLPNLHSPIAGFLGNKIVGLEGLSKTLSQVSNSQPGQVIDLGDFPLTGARVVDRYTYEITINGVYPQFVYWLAMPFFSPMPAEATRFYAQPLLQQKNITLDWFPVGSGAYQLAENNPNKRMVLTRNPNFHGASYPTSGAEGDRQAGLLVDAGRPMPFIDQAIFSLEKESIPIWNKFLQGYYDRSGISSDSFDQAVEFGNGVDAEVTQELSDKGVSLQSSVATSTIYIGFNMLDPLVGGYSEPQQKLRQAIAIALDMEEYIAIFRNGRGIAMHSPLPPGIFGYQEHHQGINPMVYDWQNGIAVRKPVSTARQLLAEAGYPGGRHQTTNQPLSIHFDTAASGPDAKAFLDWLRKQFAKIDIQLVARSTDYNRFQDKVRSGQVQMYLWGWNADYPDPENFMFLLYGPNSQVPDHGENSSNFQLPEFDQLFEQMRNLPNGIERQVIIDRMVELFHRQSPWAGGFHPQDFALQHSWVSNVKPSHLAHDTLQYQRIDPELRARLRRAWNRPVWWPLGGLVVVVALLVLPAFLLAWRREHQLPHGRRQ